MAITRLKCPDVSLSKEERITILLKQLEHWLNSPSLIKLLEAFDLKLPKNLDFIERVKLINNFVNDKWDFRKKLGERWNITEDDLTENQKELILNAAAELGLYEITKPFEDFNYVLSLGGAGMSNYDRPMFAKELVLTKLPKECSIVGLSGYRPIAENERILIDKFAPEAETEFEALTEGIIKTFGIKDSDYTNETENKENQNLSWEVRNYNDKYHTYPIFSLAAPSSDPTRRANSRDTFEFFLEKFNIDSEDKILLVTNCIYVPYQFLAFVDLAIDQGFTVDCVGTPPQKFLSNYTNYLQEIKATINQISRLIMKYRKN